MTEMDKLHDQLIDETGIVVEPLQKDVGIAFEQRSMLLQLMLSPAQARMMARLLVDAAEKLESEG